MAVKAVACPIPGKVGKRSFCQDWKRYRQVYLMLLPVLLYYIIFHYIPMAGVVIAFQDYKPALGIFESNWVGFKHFISFFRGPCLLYTSQAAEDMHHAYNLCTHSHLFLDAVVCLKNPFEIPPGMYTVDGISIHLQKSAFNMCFSYAVCML